MDKAKAYIIIVGISVMILGFSYYLVNINTGLTKKEVLNIVHELNADSIEYFMFCPTTFYRTIVKDTLYISDYESIKKLSNELVRIKKYSPNHPMTEWNVKIKVKLKSKVMQNFHIDITQASDDRNGTCLWIIKESFWGEFNLGEYRNDALGEVIKGLIVE